VKLGKLKSALNFALVYSSLLLAAFVWMILMEVASESTAAPALFICYFVLMVIACFLVSLGSRRQKEIAIVPLGVAIISFLLAFLGSPSFRAVLRWLGEVWSSI
jgi:isoprenylcysteine carboxyl methyltransferase (ICMT) family protein YpbQ